MFLDLLFAVLLPTALTMAAAVFFARRPSVSDGEFDSDSVSFAGGVLAALFTVVLAFYIVFAWQQGADLDSAAATEANAVVDTHWQAAVLDEPDREAVRALLVEYAENVAGSEWAALAQGTTDPRTPEIVRELRAELTALPADGGVVETARDQGLRNVRMIDEGRRARVDLGTSGDNFTNVLLIGTVIGGVLMVGFPLSVGLSGRPVNLAVLAVLTLTVGATVFVSLQLTTPFDGPFGIGPEAFLDALDQMSPSA